MLVIADTLPSWAEHLDLVQVIVVTLCMIVAWSARTWINSQTDINNANLEEHKSLHGRITTVEKDLSKLIGAHEANH